MVKTTYKKKNGELVDKITFFEGIYKKGQTNGFGWEVIDVQYLYKNNYYPIDKYYDLLDRDLQKDKRIREFKRNFTTIYNSIHHVVTFVILFKILANLAVTII